MNDLDFVRSCVEGDNQSWNEFLARYSRLIYKYIRSVLNSHPASQGHGDDVFQALLTSLIQDDYKKLKSFRGKNGCTLASWLRQVSINFTLSYLRGVKPEFSLEAENRDGAALGDLLADGAAAVPELLQQEEMYGKLEDCIGELNNQSKLLIELNINQGVRLEALKDLFKISRGAIDMQKSRIMERLRECFRRKGFALDL
ncbi:MAG: sigma-70 family RNA polymerase sigma factor [Candidatus Omnitrophota bacterium]